MFAPLAIFVVSAAMCCLLCIVAHRLLLRWQIIDRPNVRSSHTQPTVRGGGIAIIATLLGMGAWIMLQSTVQPLLTIGLCMLTLAVISFVDDLKSIRVVIRLGCHILAAGVALSALGFNSIALGFSPDGVLLPAIVTAVLGCVWIVGYTNGFNFMDGINGIAAGQAAITCLGMALLAGLASGDFASTPVLLSLAIAGAAFGFLPHNFPKARMFMGDVGSAPLGFLLGVLVLWLAGATAAWLLIPLALLHANFVLDTGITLFRRIVRGDKWHQAHREHFYQRLVRSGKSHAFVTGWETGLQCIVLALMILYVQASMPVRAGLIALVILIWLSFFAFCEVSFRKAGLRSSTSDSLSVGAEGRGEVDSLVS